MTWLNLAAFAGLAFVAVPILVHLLARRNARRQPFPSLRFIEDSRAVAPSRARLSDPLLLAIRMGVIGLAAAALAQPMWLTDARRSSAARAVARVIIVDTSQSMRRRAQDETGLVGAHRVAAQVAGEGGESRMVETHDPASQLAGSSEWLATSSAGRREVVIVSDFQLGVLGVSDLSRVPDSVGVRLIRIAVDTSTPVSAATLSPADVRTEGDSTFFDGDIRVLARDEDQPAATVTHRVALAALSRSMPTQRPIAVVFPGFPQRDSVLRGAEDVLDPWMADVVWRLRADSLRALRGMRNGAPELVLVTDAAVGTVDAAFLLRDAARAARGVPFPGEAEPQVVGDSTLRAWERVAGQTTAPLAAAGSHVSDGRFFWIAVLLLLALEYAVRRRLHA